MCPLLEQANACHTGHGRWGTCSQVRGWRGFCRGAFMELAQQGSPGWRRSRCCSPALKLPAPCVSVETAIYLLLLFLHVYRTRRSRIQILTAAGCMGERTACAVGKEFNMLRNSQHDGINGYFSSRCLQPTRYSTGSGCGGDFR